MKTSVAITVVAFCFAMTAQAVWAGGESVRDVAPRYIPGVSARTIERSALRGPSLIPRDPPSCAADRPLCWGKKCNEFYGPTYYYPSDKLYEGNHPQYYPFFHPTQWPNYKADPPALAVRQCGSSRSLGFWDSYDDWTRGGRYEERQ